MVEEVVDQVVIEVVHNEEEEEEGSHKFREGGRGYLLHTKLPKTLSKISILRWTILMFIDLVHIWISR